MINLAAGKSHLGRSVHHVSEATAAGLGGGGRVSGSHGCMLGASRACGQRMSLGAVSHAARLHTSVPQTSAKPGPFPPWSEGYMDTTGMQENQAVSVRGKCRAYFPALTGESEIPNLHG